MSFNVKMVIVETSHKESPLRTEEVIGKATDEPKVGEMFLIYAPPLIKGFVRFVNTSEVQRIKPTDTGWILYTRNSVYKVDRLVEPS